MSGSLKAEALPLRNDDFYKEADIELILGQEVTRLEAREKKVFLKNGTAMSYDALLLATGGIPRNLNVPGADLENVLTLRSPDDADRIIAAAGQIRTGGCGRDRLHWYGNRGCPAPTRVECGGGGPRGNAPGEGAGEGNRGDVAETS